MSQTPPALSTAAHDLNPKKSPLRLSFHVNMRKNERNPWMHMGKRHHLPARPGQIGRRIRGGSMAQPKRIDIANLTETAIRGHLFVSFDVAMNGHLISTIDAPVLSGRILWSQAAIHGFGDFDSTQQHLIADKVGSALSSARRRGH
jgi:hypothetical protein